MYSPPDCSALPPAKHLIKVWKQADFSAFPDEKKKELLSWLGKLDPAKADELAVVNKFLEKPELVRAWEFAFEGTLIRRNVNVLESISTALQRGIKDIPDVVSNANHPNIYG
ncbi:MAG: hypothetical protein R2828_03325 [Saprospiraceae bacterium]